jgi:hypothetical protein
MALAGGFHACAGITNVKYFRILLPKTKEFLFYTYFGTIMIRDTERDGWTDTVNCVCK